MPTASGCACPARSRRNRQRQSAGSFRSPQALDPGQAGLFHAPIEEGDVLFALRSRLGWLWRVPQVDEWHVSASAVLHFQAAVVELDVFPAPSDEPLIETTDRFKGIPVDGDGAALPVLEDLFRGRA